MADYTTSAFLAAQGIITAEYAEHEQRERQYPILAKGLSAAPLMYANINDLKDSEKRDIKLYQFKRDTATNSTALTHDPSGSQGDTLEITPTWNVYAEEFALYMNAGLDNVFNNGQMLANRIKEKQRIIRTRLGVALLTSLHTNRNSAEITGLLNATWNSTNTAFEIADEEMFFAYLKSVMEQHDHTGDLDVLVGPKLAPLARKLANQGGSNSVNSAWQLEGMTVMQHVDLGTTIATTYTAPAIALPANSFAYIPFVRKDFREGGGDFDSYNGGRTVINDAIFGDALQYTLFGRTVGANGAANGGTTNDNKTTWQIAATVAVQQAEISATGEETPHEFALVA